MGMPKTSAFLAIPSLQSSHGLNSWFKGPHGSPSLEPTSVLDLATISPASSPGTSPNRFIAGTLAPSLHKSIIYRSYHMQNGSNKYNPGSCGDSKMGCQAITGSPVTNFNTGSPSLVTLDAKSSETQADVLDILEGMDAELDIDFILKTENTFEELCAHSPHKTDSDVGNLWDEPVLDVLPSEEFMDVQGSLYSVDETLPITIGARDSLNGLNDSNLSECQPDTMSPLASSQDGQNGSYGLYEADQKGCIDMSESMASQSINMASMSGHPHEKCMFQPSPINPMDCQMCNMAPDHTRSPEVMGSSPDSSMMIESEPCPFWQPISFDPSMATEELRSAGDVAGFKANIGFGKSQEEQGLQLVHFLLGCAEMVGERQYGVVQPFLRKLLMLSSPEGNPMERIAFYFSETLLKRIANDGPTDGALSLSDYACSLSQNDIDKFYLALYQALPYTKFLHFTANQAIAEAVADSSHIHVIDFDIQQGIQWPNFFQSLAVRPHGPPKHLKISAIGPCISRLNQTGRMLGEFADSLGLNFGFVPIVVKNVQELHLGMFKSGGKSIEYGNYDRGYDESDDEDGAEEAIAVNFPALLHSQVWEGVTIESFLKIVRKLHPKVLTIMKAERHNDAPSFVHKFIEVLFYYSALFDSLEVSLERKSPERARIERVVLSNGLKNIISVGEENLAMEASMEKWKTCLDKAGFHQSPFSNHSFYQAKLLLNLYSSQSFRIESSSNTLALSIGWKETPLFAVMASSPSF